ncbi:sulfur carrier protein ThiS [Nitrosomonas eutropha]|uniref:Sulfur carrier protein ThiS n=1 Tax=Nitrosomonas eutropha TaxID=916 RepID=A0A1I7H2X4_9PROT|nr:sulfur carrier protein ThiS [Nitrosomonas eutropha]SFU54972.1 sulfur carrier protein ThiS [Nitrosomonas eutropha]
MQLIINGQQQSYDGPLNIQQLVEYLSLQNKRIAIERNGEIIPRSSFPEQILNDGDQLEIIVAVGGG